MENFLTQLWDNLTAVSVPILILGLALQSAQTCFVALAWRNILRAAYPEGGVKYDTTLAYYGGGVGLNSILPASAGTVAMLGLFRANIKGATVAGLVGATFVENIFFLVVGALVYAWLFISVSGSFDVKLGGLADNWVAIVIIVLAGTALVVVIGKILWRRFKRTWANAKEGGAVLSMPRVYLIEVVGVEAISYAARMGVNATFMYAFHIPVSVENVFLIVASASISSTVALAPGAVGAQTAMARVVLDGVASPAAINAYSVGQAVITTAWNCVFGLTLLARAIGWKQTRELMHVKKKDEGDGKGADGVEPGVTVDPAVDPPPPAAG